MIKKIMIFIVFVMCIIGNAKSQDIRPKWTKQAIIPPRGASYLIEWGEGIGYTLEEARKKAFVDAVNKALYLAGKVKIKEQDIDKLYSDNMDAIILISERKIRQLCYKYIESYGETDVINNRKIKVWMIIQFQKDYSIDDMYISQEEVSNYCNDLEFDKAIEKRNKAIEKNNTKFFTKGHNNYLYWGINIGYPSSFGLSFGGRYGRVFGFGYYGTIGLIFANEYDTYTYYSIGLRAYYYKNLYASIDFSTLTCKYQDTYNDNEGYFKIGGYKYGYGPSINLGYNFLSNSLKEMKIGRGGEMKIFYYYKRKVALFLGISGGYGYDIILNEWKFIGNLKLGMAF